VVGFVIGAGFFGKPQRQFGPAHNDSGHNAQRTGIPQGKYLRSEGYSRFAVSSEGCENDY